MIKTIRYFPNIYPDELLYSAYSRYYSITGKGSIKTTFSELFGIGNSIVSVINFPCHIDSFLSQFEITDYYTAEDIIFKFTMIPIYFPFLDRERQVYSVNTMKNNDGKGISMKLGVMAGSLKLSQHLKYCPDCICEDIKTYGKAFWHRSHNIEGVILCYKHHKLLRTHCPICNVPINTKDKYNLTPLKDTCINGHDLSTQNSNLNNMINSNIDLEHHISVAKIVNYILNSNNRTNDINIKTIYEKYLYKLSNMNLLTPKGFIRQRELKNQFIKFYGSDFLISLKLSFDCDEQYSWLEELFHKKIKSTHPIKHILLIIFLCKNNETEIKKLLTDVNGYSINTFGKAPWPCLNPVADHYLKNVVTNCKITTCTDTRKPVGTFECNCGFIYSRRGPDTTENDKYKVGRIKAFGDVWEEKLKHIILTKGGSLNSIAEKMKADPATIKKYATKLGLNYCFKSKPMNDEINTHTKDTPKASNIIEICIQHSNNIQTYILSLAEPPSINQIRNLFQKEYSYLYRHNKTLLETSLKGCSKNTKTNNKNNRVNWQNRDIELYFLVYHEIKSLLSSEKQIRITKSKIGKDLGISSLLEQHSYKLPKTQSLINKSVESVEDFQIRRVKTIAIKTLNNNETLTEWKLYRTAGIKKTCSFIVKLEINKILNEQFM